MNPLRARLLTRYRLALGFFMLALIVSGLTAFPLLLELEWLVAARGYSADAPPAGLNSMDYWLLTVRDGLRDTYAKYPWIAYGTDWLAFAHLIIALFLIGPLCDPVRNVWVVQASALACLCVIPLALICGQIRGIPFGWRLIDCSFGVVGLFPLWYCLRLTAKLQEHDRS